MKRLLSMLTVLVLLVSLAALAEEDRKPWVGKWTLALLYADGMSMNASSYGLNVTLEVRQDGSSVFDYAGEIDESMSWYEQEGRAYLKGYNPDCDVELDVFDTDSLRLEDNIGTLYFERNQ